ncbi:hypothetical protein [Brevibacillus massiliensis]|jgi:hypothetical protein|uniref:hypothetical protein n=1 Tax=Brevibacillus massiliensis TaxID=1118054 RepID=UPI0002DA65E7|nr:hypothetical protein [Brevibacillus massiliensis]
MKLSDALFNWLQISVVADARPDDRSARDTEEFFRDILTQDHQVSQVSYSKDETMYILRYEASGVQKMQMYEIEAVEQLLRAIENEPKCNC